jgi:hypothetical protein
VCSLSLVYAALALSCTVEYSQSCMLIEGVQWGSIETNGITQRILFLTTEERFIQRDESHSSGSLNAKSPSTLAYNVLGWPRPSQSHRLLQRSVRVNPTRFSTHCGIMPVYLIGPHLLPLTKSPRHPRPNHPPRLPPLALKAQMVCPLRPTDHGRSNCQ